METRFLFRASQRIPRPSLSRIQSRLSSSNSSSSSSTNATLTQQAIPVGNYYSSMLTTPAVYASMYPSKHRKPAAAPPPSRAFDTKSADSMVESAILFSPRTVTKWERKADARSKSTLVAGVWVPPKPAEPDNCCMSGCVNCVWDLYGEELEEWAMAKKAGDQALAMQAGDNGDLAATGNLVGKGKDGAPGAASMDDGGGTESNWGAGLETGIKTEDLLKDVPVGIREFMKVERMLKERHTREGTRGDGR